MKKSKVRWGELLLLLGIISAPLHARADYTATPVPTTTWGTWDAWGTSLAWFGTAFGNQYSVAEALFGTNQFNFYGTTLPGLGFNFARYNTGACGTNTVNGQGMVYYAILPEYEVQGYWINPAGTDPSSTNWNWSLDANQRTLLLNAQALGANRFELFANSPMWWMCSNLSPTGNGSGSATANLDPTNYDEFAVELATIAAYFKTNCGLAFTTVEPFNEPVSSWWTTNGTALQEGCNFPNASQPAMIADLRTELNNRGLNTMPISSPDDNQFDQTYNTWNSYSALTQSEVGQINSHAYQGTGGNQAGVYSQATAAGKTLYVSEYGDNDLSGLTMASIITYEVSTLHPTGWTYWQALDADGKDKNWGMINASDSALTIGPVEPKYYVMAQYSRHIRQGMTIITSGDTNSLAAYDPVAQKLVIVTLNPAAAQTITYNLNNFANVSGPIMSWTTTPAASQYYVEKTNLPLSGKIFSSAFAANSVQTFEINLIPASIAITAASANPNPAYPGQSVTISATVTDTNPVSTVTVDTSAVGGLSNQVLTSNGMGSYTNGITVGAAIGLGVHTLVVNASDTLGNMASPFPFNINITPSITITAAAASPNPAYSGQSVTISGTVMATNPVSTVTVDASAIGGLSNQILASNGAGNYTNSIIVGSATVMGIHTLTVNAKDNLGNIALPFPFTLDIAAVTVTWTGAMSANWAPAGNWSGVHTPPANGDTPAFGIQGAGGLTLTNNLLDYTLLGLNFNATAPAFILNGNAFTNTGELADNSLNIETINLPLILNGTQTVNVGGGAMILNGLISQQGTSGLTKNGPGTVTLTGETTGANSYVGTTTINGGTLELDFNTGGSTPSVNIISSSSPLNFGGGALLINGATSGGSAQSFAGTSLTAGGNVMSLVNNGTTPTLALGTVAVSPGTTLNLSTNGIITTTTLGGAAAGMLGNGIGPNSTAGYATYGLFDWATTDTTGGAAGTSPATIIGLSSVAGGYAANYFPGTGQGANTDLTASYTVGANTGTTTIRFNTPGANNININGKWLVVSAILVTPNMGANNATIWSGNGTTAGGQWYADYSSVNAQNEFVWQNNTAGYFINNGTLVNGRGQAPGTATLTYIQSGPGTVVMGTGAGSTGGFYSGQSYLNGGCTVVTTDICLGNPATAAMVVLNGGTLVGNATMILDNGSGANPRPFTLTGNGGGLAATAGNTMTIDGVISGASPFTIGIPASTANGNKTGLLPGSGAGTANTIAVNATGIVVLTGTNTCTGSIAIASGTLQLGAGGSINNSPNIIVGSGTTYDVSLAGGYTLNAGQNLMGSGAVNGSLTASSGSGIYGGTDGTYGTNTFNNNLIFAAGALAYFDVGTSSNNGSNDEIIVNGNLTLNSTAIHLKAPSTLATLASGNYTLFSSPNAITINGTLQLVWDVAPANSSWASITNTGNAIILNVAPPIVAPPPMAMFVALTSTNIFVTQSVIFTNTSTGNITNSAWNFGDGNTTNLSGVNVTGNVTDTYTSLGTNNVILTVTGSGGSSAATNRITVLPKPALGQLVLTGRSFIFSGTNGAPGQTYRILTTTNLALASSNWTTAFSGTFNPNGSYNYTNTALTNIATFFRLISP